MTNQVASLSSLSSVGVQPRHRLLIVNSTSSRVGGTEDYLASIIPELHNRGYKLAFVSEVDSQADRLAIELPQDSPQWCIAAGGRRQSLQDIRLWEPQIIYAHGELTVDFEKQILQMAPAIYFAHNYYGTCISGYKAHKWPSPRPCSRTLGSRCLVNYLPLRCGGLSPVTMFRRYFNERSRLQNMHLYAGIVTHSEHMRAEYIHHGLPPERVFNFVYEAGTLAEKQDTQSPNFVSVEALRIVQTPVPKPHRLIFLGRMEKLKGGQTLIAAVPKIQSQLKSPIEITFGGDGPERKRWENLARKTEALCPAASFTFPGWLSKEQVSSHLQSSDVLVVPSLWPEPFGRVGIQAGQLGIPVAAFAVGGIPEWLKDGVNGRLAPGDPPTADGLASAVLDCLNDRLTHDFSKGGREISARFSTTAHVDQLVSVFERTLSQKCKIAALTSENSIR